MTEFSFEHGGDLEKAGRLAECSPKELIDFSNLLNPSSVPPGLEEFLKSRLDEFFRHPSSGEGLQTKIAEKIGVLPSQIFLGAGTTEFIHGLPWVLHPRNPVIVGPTYGDYAPALQRVGAEPKYFLAREDKGWEITEAEWEVVLEPNPDYLILARPNNPLGQSFRRELLKKLIGKYPKTFFVVDETCIEIADDPLDHLILNPWPVNLAVLRSFSKTYAVPGLRLGYLVISPELRPQMEKSQMSWTVSPLALAAGEYLLDQEGWLQESRHKNREEKKRILAQLKALTRFKVFPSTITAFTLKGLAPSFCASGFLKQLLMEEKLFIRSLSRHPGLGEAYFRVGLRTPAENDRLIMVLRKRDR